MDLFDYEKVSYKKRTKDCSNREIGRGGGVKQSCLTQI